MSSVKNAPMLKPDELLPEITEFLEAWRIPYAANIVQPQENNLPEVALWRSEEFDHRGDSPVFAVPLTVKYAGQHAITGWLYGVAQENKITSSPDALTAYWDVAVHPAKTFNDALGILTCIAPPQKLTRTQMLRQLHQGLAGS